jgi:hypothetical protein
MHVSFFVKIWLLAEGAERCTHELAAAAHAMHSVCICTGEWYLQPCECCIVMNPTCCVCYFVDQRQQQLPACRLGLPCCVCAAPLAANTACSKLSLLQSWRGVQQCSMRMCGVVRVVWYARCEPSPSCVTQTIEYICCPLSAGFYSADCSC